MSPRGQARLAITDRDGRLVVAYDGASHEVPLEGVGPSQAMVAADQPPSVLIDARMELVPFLDHAGILADLVGWMVSEDTFGVRVLSGPAGVGKTRTARRLCHEAQRRAWLAGMLAADAEVGAIRELARTPASLLVVVDHAETRYGQLAALVPLLAAHASRGHQARLVLTVRDPPVPDRFVDDLSFANQDLNFWLRRGRVHDLAQQLPDAAARQELFTRACQALATHLSVPSPAVAGAGEAGAILFSNPMMIVVSAYLRVYGESPPASAAELLDRFIDEHEDPYWRRRVTALGAPLGDKHLRRRAAALATLAGARAESDALRLVALVEPGVPASSEQQLDVARWAAGLQRGPWYWNPLQPDLLAEHLVATTWGHDPVVLDTVLSQGREGALRHPLGMLARAVPGRPQMIPALREVLDQRLGQLCERSMQDSALAAALTGLVGVCPPDPDRMPDILDRLPAQSDLGIRFLASALNEQLTQHYRSRAERDPDEYGPKLAVALNNLSVRLADVGRTEAALAAIGEAVARLRVLVRTDPNGQGPNLAITLWNLSLRLADTGRADQAITALREAVGLLRSLADTDPPSYRPRLADSLRELSHGLADTGHPDEAATAVREAVGLFRTLAAIDPGSYRPRLAASLRDLGRHLADVGSQQTARAAVTEAVTLYRDLARDDPVHLPDLVGALQDLAARLQDLGLRKEARTRHAEAAVIRQRGREPRGPRSPVPVDAPPVSR